MAKLIIFGAGDIARLAHYYFTRDSQHQVVAFTADQKYLKEESFLELPLVAFENVAKLYSPQNYKMFVALSYAKMNKVRAEKYYEAKQLGYELVSYVSTRCSFLTDYPVGENCFILEDNTIQPFVRIGNNVTLWSGNHIGHDSTIEDHCFLASHIVVSGYVHIHPFCFIGVNATLRNSIDVVMSNTLEKGVYLPSRAKLFDKTSDEIEL
jgi:sugar O-acyltransferase (sialic acid O-acetyltransferase NeuD family)